MVIAGEDRKVRDVRLVVLVVVMTGITRVAGRIAVEILGERTVSGILLDTGKHLTGDLVLISAGVKLTTDLAQGAGLNVKRGVVVDRHMQTSIDDVYAAGDVTGGTFQVVFAAAEGAQAALNAVKYLRSLKKE